MEGVGTGLNRAQFGFQARQGQRGEGKGQRLGPKEGDPGLNRGRLGTENLRAQEQGTTSGAGTGT